MYISTVVLNVGIHYTRPCVHDIAYPRGYNIYETEIIYESYTTCTYSSVHKTRGSASPRRRVSSANRTKDILCSKNSKI